MGVAVGHPAVCHKHQRHSGLAEPAVNPSHLKDANRDGEQTEPPGKEHRVRSPLFGFENGDQ